MSTNYSDEFDLDIRLFASQNQIAYEFVDAEKKRTKKNTCADDTCVSCKKTCGDDTCRSCARACEPTQRKSCDGSCFLTCSTCAGEATCNFARAPKGAAAKGSKKGKKGGGEGEFLVCK
jgi:hypothetical protein